MMKFNIHSAWIAINDTYAEVRYISGGGTYHKYTIRLDDVFDYFTKADIPYRRDALIQIIDTLIPITNLFEILFCDGEELL